MEFLQNLQGKAAAGWPGRIWSKEPKLGFSDPMIRCEARTHWDLKDHEVTKSWVISP